MGGFARRMSYFNAFAKKYPSRPYLRLDGGSIFNQGVVEAPVLNRWMLEGTYRSNLDGINLSAWDVPVWQELADLAAAGQIPKEYLEVPLVSANVKPKVANYPLVQRYIIKEYPVDSKIGKRVRIGITGLLIDLEERISRQDFQIDDPVQAAKQVFEELQGKVDYRIILTDMDLGRAVSLAVAVPKINIILIAHDYAAISEPQQVGDTLLVIPVNEGRMVSEVRLNISPKSDAIDVQARFVQLDRTVPDDPAMAELVRKAQAAIDDLKKAK
jgi:2',3'-cyclic-nucleotide 2'-phosphodiesterase (5'-nucleotidase family)